MESYGYRKSKIEILWMVLGFIGTIVLCAATHINLDFISAADDTSRAVLGLFGLFLRIIVVVPLLCAVPALWARCAWITRPLVLILFTILSYAAGLIFENSYVDALYFAGMIAPAGIILYLLQRYQYSNFYTVFYLSVAILAGLFIRVSLKPLIENGDAFLPMKEVVALYRTVWEASSEGIFPEEMSTVMQEMLTQLKLGSDQYLVELLYYPAALAALINGLLSHLLNKKGGAELVTLPAFEDWTVERGYVYGSLVLTVGSYILTLTGQSFGNALLQIAYPVWMLPMSLAGICYLKKRTKGKVWLFVLLTVLGISMYSIFGWALSLLGMFGFFRKEQEKRKQGGSEK